MNCVICNQQAPADMDDVVQQGCPDYYVAQDLMEGPACPECIDKHLWLSQDGEWEARIPKEIAHKYN